MKTTIDVEINDFKEGDGYFTFNYKVNIGDIIYKGFFGSANTPLKEYSKDQKYKKAVDMAVSQSLNKWRFGDESDEPTVEVKI